MVLGGDRLISLWPVLVSEAAETRQGGDSHFQGVWNSQTSSLCPREPCRRAEGFPSQGHNLACPCLLRGSPRLPPSFLPRDQHAAELPTAMCQRSPRAFGTVWKPSPVILDCNVRARFTVHCPFSGAISCARGRAWNGSRTAQGLQFPILVPMLFL